MQLAIPTRSRPGHSPAMLWLSAGLCLAVLPHTLHIPVWSSVLFFLLLGARLSVSSHTTRKNFSSSSFIKFILAIIIFTSVFIHFGTLVGRDAGVTLLVLLGGMKLLEIRTDRDYYISSYIAFLLILTNFFYSQTLATSLYMGVTLVVLIAALISFNDRDNSLKLQGRLQTAALLFLHALPLMLIMFLMFPRMSGPLWGLPKDALAGITGIDDEMSPGSISQLILSDQVAFRVAFEGEIPEKSQLYWRGPVLWYTDGYKWVPDNPRQSSARIITDSDPVRYTVTLEATDKNWLYALELPGEAAENSRLSHDLQFRTRRSVTSRTRYEASAWPDAIFLSENPEELEDALQLPGNYHQEAIALAQSWRAQGLDDAQIVQRALRYFNEETFYYTLTPPALTVDTVDEFLFDTRQGFCEHYAAAFVVLMRGAGIPARVVTGYQGGTINPVGNYLIVHQRDAHAWTEVWLGQERGWVRVDPTSAVSPSRVTDGIQSAIPQSLITVPLGLYNNTFARGIWERMNNTFDAINNRWNQWVLGYDRNRQRMLLGRIGLGDLNRRELMAGMIVIVVLSLAIIGWGIFSHTRETTDHARKWYDRFRHKLVKSGIRVYAHEGPVDLANRAGGLRADLADTIHTITGIYTSIRYGGHPDKLEALKSEVKKFSPGKKNTSN
ncbi:MAG: DUF3488 and transglutaminase-like domain-containing protein [Gammaproteobacteria bacterium]